MDQFVAIEFSPTSALEKKTPILSSASNIHLSDIEGQDDDKSNKKDEKTFCSKNFFVGKLNAPNFWEFITPTKRTQNMNITQFCAFNFPTSSLFQLPLPRISLHS